MTANCKSEEHYKCNYNDTDSQDKAPQNKLVPFDIHAFS
jgi:hypothetical protein